MDWTAPSQLVGYLGTSCFLFNATLLAWKQKTNGIFWTITWTGNMCWVTAGYLMGSPAVMIDAIIFLPIHFTGTYRYFNAYKNSKRKGERP